MKTESFTEKMMGMIPSENKPMFVDMLMEVSLESAKSDLSPKDLEVHEEMRVELAMLTDQFLIRAEGIVEEMMKMESALGVIPMIKEWDKLKEFSSNLMNKTIKEAELCLEKK